MHIELISQYISNVRRVFSRWFAWRLASPVKNEKVIDLLWSIQKKSFYPITSDLYEVSISEVFIELVQKSAP